MDFAAPKAQAVAGSYRDPAGRVLQSGGRVYRAIYEPGRPALDLLESSPFIKGLMESRRLVALQKVAVEQLGLDDGADPIAALELEPLAFVSHPYEWSFAALRTAALFHLDLQLEALDHGITLSDATAYNVQFKGTQPVFIDHLSFKPYSPGELWRGHRQFCEQFLHPLLLQAKTGIPFHAWYRGTMEGIPGGALVRALPGWRCLAPRMLMHVVLPHYFDSRASRHSGAPGPAKGRLPEAGFRSMLKGLRNWVASLTPRWLPGQAWADYESTHSYAPEDMALKQDFVAAFTSEVKPRMLWDLGCNTGRFAELALENGAESCIGFDADPATVNAAFERAAAKGSNFLPLLQDFQNPSPSLGWRQAERPGLAERRNADTVLALALLHHLVIGKNIPMTEAVGWIVETAPVGIIEFIPKSDPVVPRMLQNRIDIFDGYTEDAFDAAIRDHARVVKETKTGGSGRKLVWFERRT